MLHSVTEAAHRAYILCREEPAFLRGVVSVSAGATWLLLSPASKTIKLIAGLMDALGFWSIYETGNKINPHLVAVYPISCILWAFSDHRNQPYHWQAVGSVFFSSLMILIPAAFFHTYKNEA